jgi:hypothetical protein
MDAMEKLAADLNRLRRDTSSSELNDIERDVLLLDEFWMLNASDAARHASATMADFFENNMVGSSLCDDRITT